MTKLKVCSFCIFCAALIAADSIYLAGSLKRKERQLLAITSSYQRDQTIRPDPEAVNATPATPKRLPIQIESLATTIKNLDQADRLQVKLSKYLSESRGNLIPLVSTVSAQDKTKEAARHSEPQILRIPVRTIRCTGNSRQWARQIDSVDLHKDKAAIVLIDTLASNGQWFKRTTRLVQIARAHGMTVVHVPHKLGRLQRPLSPIDPELTTQDIVIASENEAIINLEDPTYLLDYLSKKNIKTVFYAGYCMNICLYYRPAGVWYFDSYAKSRNAEFRIILIRDCTGAQELLGVDEEGYQQVFHESIAELNLGGTVASQDIIAALNENLMK